MIDLKSLIPRDKYDIESVEKLKNLEPSTIKPILPDLFEWIQDSNWPVAREIVNILISCGRDIVPELKKALESGDEGWQYTCFFLLIKKLPLEIIKEITPELQRIAYQPNIMEKYNEFDNEAKEILKSIGDI